MTSVPTRRLPRGANLWPWTGSGYGPLPPLLVVLTIVTGLVDAVSYVALGHVFVANMTGNVVFLGFALAGAPGLSAVASLVALGGFALGALVGGKIATRLGQYRGWHLRTATAAAFVLVAVAVLLSAIAGSRSRKARVTRSSSCWRSPWGYRTPLPAGSPYPISPPPS